MNQGKMEQIAVIDIIVRHEYLPTKETAARRYSIFLKSEGPQIHVYRNQYGELLLAKGIEAYNALMVIDPNKRVSTFVVSEKVTEIDWTFQLLHYFFSENAYFMLKYEYIMLLLNETKRGVKKICDRVGCTVRIYSNIK